VNEEVRNGVEEENVLAALEGNGAGEEVAGVSEAADSEPTMEEQLADAKAQADEYLEGWQRALADFDNARKRMKRESAATYRNATIDVLSRLLPVIDDYERAMNNVPPAFAEDSWFEGVQLVQRKLKSFLENSKIEIIPSVGELFDPNVHSAILKEPSEEYESGIVVRELQTGYRLGERVIRPTLVVVAD